MCGVCALIGKYGHNFLLLNELEFDIIGNDNKQLKKIGDYGLKVGLCFQIADDILDVSGSTAKLGKNVGKDEQAGKLTYPSLMGLDKSRQVAATLVEEAKTALSSFGRRADPLRWVAEILLKRTS